MGKNNPPRRFSENLRFYHLDEFVAVESRQTFAEDLRREFIEPLGIRDFRSWPYEQRTAVEAIEAIESEFLREPPEVCILGIGTNGHIGFNEPGSTLSSRSRVTQLDEGTRKALAERFGGENQVPKHAIAMGIATILRARKIIVIASGEKKTQTPAPPF